MKIQHVNEFVIELTPVDKTLERFKYNNNILALYLNEWLEYNYF